jgi:hypothetical protein
MKKCLMLGTACVVVALLSGCAAFTSGYSLGGGYPGTMPGIVIADQMRGGMIHAKVESMKDMEVLGPVSSKVSANNVFMLLSSGDASIGAAKKYALQKYPQADDVVNVETDMHHFGVLSIFNIVTLEYRGIAIKYKK